MFNAVISFSSVRVGQDREYEGWFRLQLTHLTRALQYSQRYHDKPLHSEQVGCLDGLGEVRGSKGQDKVFRVKHLSIPPYGNSPYSTDLLVSHIL
ncbi:hypothetical protein TNCV_544731 [Trichonephila clavipes]|nr:hypothetical protein TNCV_544731 [Trichonephila clavipes]